jgi:hypothetical protein
MEQPGIKKFKLNQLKAAEMKTKNFEYQDKRINKEMDILKEKGFNTCTDSEKIKGFVGSRT